MYGKEVCLEAGNLRMVEPRHSHVPGLVKLLNSDSSGSYFVHPTIVDNKYVISTIVGPFSECKLFTIADLIITDPSETIVYGRVTVIPSRNHGEAEISYIVSPVYRNNGIASAAVGLMTTHVVSEGISLLTARVIQGNEGSKLVLTRNKFHYCGTTESTRHGKIDKYARKLG